jgi:hypothetical protein
MTNISDPSSRDPKGTYKETVAPRLRELLDELPSSQPVSSEQVQDVTVTRIETARRPAKRIEGEVAAALLAPVIGIFTLSLLHLFVPVIEGLGLRRLFFDNGFSNLTVVLTLGAWLLSWVALYEAWRDRTVSRPKLYVVGIVTLMIAAACFIPEIYRLLE